MLKREIGDTETLGAHRQQLVNKAPQTHTLWGSPFLFSVVETGVPYGALATLELTSDLKRSSCLYLKNAQVKGVQPRTPSPGSALLDAPQQPALICKQAGVYLKQNAVGAGIPCKAAQGTLSSSIPKKTEYAQLTHGYLGLVSCTQGTW